MLQRRNRILALALVLFSAFLLSGCLTDVLNYLNRQPEKTLSFDTVLHSIECSSDRSRTEMRLMILDSEEDLAQLQDSTITDAAQDVDFAHDYLVAIFRERQPAYPNDVTISRVVQRNDLLIVHVEFGEPGFQAAGGWPEGQWPCHVVKIAKINGETPKRLEIRGKTVYP
ncbi:MAG: hypothetical protein KF893_02150 [Caldilineaceae bacterium]|nr:hypothetical protein [Caldilineaceae bacterium]